jgi:thiamine biosynthesis lipoprotein ApbE
VIHCLLAWRAENKAARRTASDVAAGSEIVVVGTRKNGKAWVVAVDEALHEPLKVQGTVEPPEVL